MESKHTSSSPVSTSELNQMHKHLKATKETHQADSLEYDVTIAKKIADLYEKYDGDLKAIFEELDENPRKALKHPPFSAEEFGRKYAQGFYTFAEEK